MTALSATDKRLLLERADEVEGWLIDLSPGGCAARPKEQYERMLAEIRDKLFTRKIGPASITHRGDVTTVLMLRIRSGSTMGLAVALRNWIAQARRKAGAA